MNNRLKKIKGFYKLNSDDIEKDIESSSYRCTLILLQNKLHQINRINKSILKLNTDVYSMSVLQRVLIEHYLKFFYSIIQSEKTNDDFVGISYYFIYNKSEQIKMGNYINKINNIKNKTNIQLNDLNDEFSKLTQTEINKINSIGNVFTKLDVISKRLIEYSDENESSINKIVVNIELLEFYNILSSYVHGGPFAENEINFSLANKEALEKRIAKITSISNTLTFCSFYFFFEFLNKITDDKYSKYKNYS